MNTRKAKRELQTIKIHLDMLDEWIHQTRNMIYNVEEQLLDFEEEKLSMKPMQKYPSIDYSKIFNIQEEACSL